MAQYRVDLDIFAGPLDLLLYLVRKDEVDIYDIPIANITEQYLKYLEMLKMLDIDAIGEFLVMAATLMEIKSAMLLPRAEVDEESESDMIDPRAELVRQLLEYKKFKDAANLLEVSAEDRKERFTRPDSVMASLKPHAEPELDLDQVNIWDLLEAFDKIMQATGNLMSYDHIKDDTPIDLYQIEILHRLQSDGAMTLESIFQARTSKLEMVGMFLAMLELIRSDLVWAEQPAPLGPIYLKATTDEPAEVAVQNAITAFRAAEREAAEMEAEQSEQPEKPPIPIHELPAIGDDERSFEDFPSDVDALED